VAGARVVDAQVGVFYSRGFLDYGSGPLIQKPRAPCVPSGGHTNSCGCYGGGVCYGHQLSETLEGAARYPGGMAPGYVLDSQANFDLAKPASWTCSSYKVFDYANAKWGPLLLPAYDSRTGECLLAGPSWHQRDFSIMEYMTGGNIHRLCRCCCGAGFFQPLDAITNTCSRYVPLPTRLAPAPALGNSSARGNALFCFRHVDTTHVLNSLLIHSCAAGKGSQACSGACCGAGEYLANPSNTSCTRWVGECRTILNIVH
jgi:hypothetical protein